MRITEVKLPFGQAPDGRMVGVDSVERGKDCNCVCPECKRRLIAAKGKVVRHHFRHAQAEGVCTITPETVIHKFAKQVICEKRVLRLPDKLGEMISAIPEYRMGDIIPDVYAEYKHEPVAIEVFVAHQVPEEKAELYNERRLAAVEIDLSEYRRADQDMEDWVSLILFEARRKWISPPAYVRRRREEAEAERRRIEEERRAAQKRIEEEKLSEIKNIEIQSILDAVANADRMRTTACYQIFSALVECGRIISLAGCPPCTRDGAASKRVFLTLIYACSLMSPNDIGQIFANLSGLDDHKGSLTISSNEPLSEFQRQCFGKAWQNALEYEISFDVTCTRERTFAQAEHLARQGNAVALDKWLMEHPVSERRAIVSHLYRLIRPPTLTPKDAIKRGLVFEFIAGLPPYDGARVGELNLPRAAALATV